MEQSGELTTTATLGGSRPSHVIIGIAVGLLAGVTYAVATKGGCRQQATDVPCGVGSAPADSSWIGRRYRRRTGWGIAPHVAIVPRQWHDASASPKQTRQFKGEFNHPIGR